MLTKPGDHEQNEPKQAKQLHIHAHAVA